MNYYTEELTTVPSSWQVLSDYSFVFITTDTSTAIRVMIINTTVAIFEVPNL